MRFALPSMALLTVVGLAACAVPPQTASTPMAPASAGGSIASPQPANSLPRGDVVNAPRTSPTGTVGVTGVSRGY